MARRQLHFRTTEREYEFVCGVARNNGDTVATVLRRLIRMAMKTQPPSKASSTALPSGAGNGAPNGAKEPS
jgi:hypothetical protein